MAEPATTRVALVTTSFPLAAGSVSGIFVLRLVEQLAALARVRVVVPAGTEPTPRPDAASPLYRLHAVRYAPRRWRLLAHRPGGLPAAVARRDPALVLLPAMLAGLLAASLAAGRRSDLLHGQWVLGGVLAGAAGRLLRRPVVTTLRGSDVTRAERSSLDRRLLALCLRLSSAVVAVSPGLAERVCALLPQAAGRVAVIPNGIDDAFFAVSPRLAQRGRLRLLGSGNLVPHKDVATVVRAVAALPPTAELLWLGDGPLRSDLAALAAELGAAGRIHFRGAVSPAEVPAALAECDVFVFSSHGEGRPNALLEALAAGRPAMAPDVPGVAELVAPERGVLLYPAGDAEALRRGLSRLGADAELRGTLAASARAAAASLAGPWSDTGREYHQLYRRLLAERRGEEA